MVHIYQWDIKKLPSGFQDTSKLILTGGCKPKEISRGRERNQTLFLYLQRNALDGKENKH